MPADALAPCVTRASVVTVLVPHAALDLRPTLVQVVACCLFNIKPLSPCHTRVASSRRLHGVQEKLRTPRCAQWDLLERRGIKKNIDKSRNFNFKNLIFSHFVRLNIAIKRIPHIFPSLCAWDVCYRRQSDQTFGVHFHIKTTILTVEEFWFWNWDSLISVLSY